MKGRGKKNTLVRKNNMYNCPEEGESTESLRTSKRAAWLREESKMK